MELIDCRKCSLESICTYTCICECMVHTFIKKCIPLPLLALQLSWQCLGGSFSFTCRHVLLLCQSLSFMCLLLPFELSTCTFEVSAKWVFLRPGKWEWEAQWSIKKSVMKWNMDKQGKKREKTPLWNEQWDGTEDIAHSGLALAC